ncbi:hypothetical protein [Streptomyces sp. NPDC092307]|uniref:hypothetical protein n=1 Tax=Streptomyces sp. NPDC092307 TaxID=3366013 RepID=UPI00381455DD
MIGEPPMDPLHTQSGMPESEAAAEARRLIDDWAARPVPHHPTSFRDDTAPPAFGTAPPVKQPDVFDTAWRHTHPTRFARVRSWTARRFRTAR